VSDELQRLLENAVSSAVRDVDGGMVTKWVMLAEGIDEDGERALWLVANKDALSWDTIGMLHYALALEQARINSRERGD
jgi:hypothetical protein